MENKLKQRKEQFLEKYFLQNVILISYTGLKMLNIFSSICYEVPLTISIVFSSTGMLLNQRTIALFWALWDAFLSVGKNEHTHWLHVKLNYMQTDTNMMYQYVNLFPVICHYCKMIHNKEYRAVFLNHLIHLPSAEQ